MSRSFPRPQSSEFRIFTKSRSTESDAGDQLPPSQSIRGIPIRRERGLEALIFRNFQLAFEFSNTLKHDAGPMCEIFRIKSRIKFFQPLVSLFITSVPSKNFRVNPRRISRRIFRHRGLIIIFGRFFQIPTLPLIEIGDFNIDPRLGRMIAESPLQVFDRYLTLLIVDPVNDRFRNRFVVGIDFPDPPNRHVERNHPRSVEPKIKRARIHRGDHIDHRLRIWQIVVFPKRIRPEPHEVCHHCTESSKKSDSDPLPQRSFETCQIERRLFFAKSLPGRTLNRLKNKTANKQNQKNNSNSAPLHLDFPLSKAVNCETIENENIADRVDCNLPEKKKRKSFSQRHHVPDIEELKVRKDQREPVNKPFRGQIADILPRLNRHILEVTNDQNKKGNDDRVEIAVGETGDNNRDGRQNAELQPLHDSEYKNIGVINEFLPFQLDILTEQSRLAPIKKPAEKDRHHRDKNQQNSGDSDEFPKNKLRPINRFCKDRQSCPVLDFTKEKLRRSDDREDRSEKDNRSKTEVRNELQFGGTEIEIAQKKRTGGHADRNDYQEVEEPLTDRCEKCVAGNNADASGRKTDGFHTSATFRVCYLWFFPVCGLFRHG